MTSCVFWIFFSGCWQSTLFQNFFSCRGLIKCIRKAFAVNCSVFSVLQEDKEAMFDTHDTLTGVLQVATGVLSTLKVGLHFLHLVSPQNLSQQELCRYPLAFSPPSRSVYTFHTVSPNPRICHKRSCACGHWHPLHPQGGFALSFTPESVTTGVLQMATGILSTLKVSPQSLS